MKQLLLITASLFIMALTCDAQWAAKHGMSPAGYQSFFNECTGKGMRPVCISGYTDGGVEKYAALFEKKGGPAWVTKHGLSSADYQNNFNTLSGQGYQVSFVSGYKVGGQVKYAAIWEKKNTNYVAKHGQTGAQFQAEFTTQTGKGYRLIFLTCYEAGGNAHYASIFEKSSGPAWAAHHGMDANDYQQKFNSYSSQGYRLKMVNGCNVGGKDYYAAIWEKTSGPLSYAKHGIKGNNYQNNFDNFYYQGYRPAFVSAFASSGTERFNGIWENTNFTGANLEKIDDAVKGYMSLQSVKGLSLAVCKDGRLVFAKGYGDANPSTGQDLSPNHSLRIMSISKVVTATGIVKLVQQGKLNLDKKVFGPGSVFGSKYSYPSATKVNLEKITVRSLLHHTSGLRSCNGEAPFWNASSTYGDCMSVLLNDNNLFAKTPHTEDSYSNTGFFFLGRIIEHVSGQGYETFIRNNVLAPAGVGNTMYVGSTNGEPSSREPAGYDPMRKMNLKMWDAFGGWVARPIDLLRMLVRYDGSATKPDLIPKNLYDTMTTRLSYSGSFALGWIADNNRQTHNGCFDGTRSFLYYDKGSGLSYAVIINDNPTDDGCGWKMQAAILDGLKKVTAWPGYDLF